MKRHHNLKRITLISLLYFSFLNQQVFADELNFDPEFLENAGGINSQVDLSVFKHSAVLPGDYQVDIYINEQFVTTREVTFSLLNNKLSPCFSHDDLKEIGLAIPKEDYVMEEQCINLQSINNTRFEAMPENKRLNITIPQAYEKYLYRGYVDPSLWDHGINALFVNYDFNGQNSFGRKDNDNNNSQYLNLRSGLNIANWRVRNYSTMNRGTDQKSPNWDSIHTYAQRDIAPMKSTITLGETTTFNDVFDSVPIRGGVLATNDQMYPDSMRSFAPTIRGIARTNAEVIVHQNGYMIDKRSVPAGAFEIRDLYPSSGGGDIIVTIKETDGSEQIMTIPFSSVPMLQREGKAKYEIASGVYKPYDDDVRKSPFSQATIQYGLPHGITAYGGFQGASKYQSLALGAATNFFNLGAISFDITQAWSKPNGLEKQNGQAYRFRYNKSLPDTNTHIALATYKYATSGYYDLGNVLDTYPDKRVDEDKEKNRWELTLNQGLSENYGNLSLTLSYNDFWDTTNQGDDRRISSILSYSNSWNEIYFDLSWTHNRNNRNIYTDFDTERNYSDMENIFSFSVYLPLGSTDNSTWARYALNTSKSQTTNIVGLNGQLLEDRNLTWGAQASYGSQGTKEAGNLYANYDGGYGSINGGYAFDRNYHRLDYGLAGSLILHGDGLTAGQTFYDTATLVKAPDADSVKVENNPGVKTDFRGYTVVPYATPYRKNDISLDTRSFGDDVEIDLTKKTVIPTQGAITRAEFKTRVGKRAIVELMRANGEAVPFGASVTHAGNTNSSDSFIVSDNGNVYVSGLKEKSDFVASWGTGADKQCRFSINEEQLQTNTNVSIYSTKAICQ